MERWHSSRGLRRVLHRHELRKSGRKAVRTRNAASIAAWRRYGFCSLHGSLAQTRGAKPELKLTAPWRRRSRAAARAREELQDDPRADGPQVGGASAGSGRGGVHAASCVQVERSRCLGKERICLFVRMRRRSSSFFSWELLGHLAERVRTRAATSAGAPSTLRAVSARIVCSSSRARAAALGTPPSTAQ